MTAGETVPTAVGDLVPGATNRNATTVEVEVEAEVVAPLMATLPVLLVHRLATPILNGRPTALVPREGVAGKSFGVNAHLSFNS